MRQYLLWREVFLDEKKPYPEDMVGVDFLVIHQKIVYDPHHF